MGNFIAVFPILADVVEVKKGSGSTAHWSINFIRLSGWLRRCFTLLISTGSAKIGKTAIAAAKVIFAHLMVARNMYPSRRGRSNWADCDTESVPAAESSSSSSFLMAMWRRWSGTRPRNVETAILRGRPSLCRKHSSDLTIQPIHRLYWSQWPKLHVRALTRMMTFKD